LAARKRSSLKDVSPSLVRARFLVSRSLPPLPRLSTRRVCGEHFRLCPIPKIRFTDGTTGNQTWLQAASKYPIYLPVFALCRFSVSCSSRSTIRFLNIISLGASLSPPNLSLAGMIFLERRKLWGLVAADAHGGFHLGNWFSARVPSYAATFSLAGLGIDRKYASQPEVAIRSGDFFNCIRGAGEPLVFDYFATNGVSKFTSGSTAPEGSALHARVQTAGQTVKLVLIKDGSIERRVDADHLDIPSAAAGVYRLEVYLPNHPLLPAIVPWIVANPIFIGTAPYDSHPRVANSEAVEASRPSSVGVGSAEVTAVQ
jgi:hypothetical protein